MQVVREVLWRPGVVPGGMELLPHTPAADFAMTPG